MQIFLRIDGYLMKILKRLIITRSFSLHFEHFNMILPF